MSFALQHAVKWKAVSIETSSSLDESRKIAALSPLSSAALTLSSSSSSTKSDTDFSGDALLEDEDDGVDLAFSSSDEFI